RRDARRLWPGHHAADRRQPARCRRRHAGARRRVRRSRRGRLREPRLPTMNDSTIHKALPAFPWGRVDTLRNNAEGCGTVSDVTRQVLFGGDAMRCEWRYFEVAPGGYTTLERHEHAHAVMILRGRGQCLVGDRVHTVGERDLVAVPPLAWHQFRADPDAPLGF